MLGLEWYKEHFGPRSMPLEPIRYSMGKDGLYTWRVKLNAEQYKQHLASLAAIKGVNKQ